MLFPTRFASLGAVALGLSLACAAPRTALAAPLLRGFGGPADFGPSNLPGNDDGSTSEIDVSAAFPAGLNFFGSTFRSLFVNNNGNVTFGGALGLFTPQAFPVASQRMIAPWWGDVDTRGPGYPMRNGVFWVVLPGPGAGRFVATWFRVGYYSERDELENSFQLILTDRQDVHPGDFDVEFRYEQCQWTTGNASGGTNGFGGTPAQAGFDAGNLRNYYALPGSLSMAILNVCTTSNVADPGVWRFQIRSGAISICGNDVIEPGEECDDGNTVSGDGCSATCQIERDSPPDVIEDVPEDVPEDVVDDLPVDVPADVPRDAGADADAGREGGDAAADAERADAACDGWRCGRENWLEGHAGPCLCSTPGAVGGGATRDGALAVVIACAATAGWRRRTRRGRR